MLRIHALSALVVGVVLTTAQQLAAQTYTPIKQIPGGELMQRMQSAMAGIGDGGAVGSIRWNLIAGELCFEKNGWKTMELATGRVQPMDGEPPESALPSRVERGSGSRRPARGRQFTSEASPDGAWTALSEDGNPSLDTILRVARAVGVRFHASAA